MIVALTVAGSDSVGGAGIQADIKAMASQGVHAAVALTAITAQNTQRVAGVFPLPPRVVVDQIDAVLEDVTVSGAKTGMLYSSEIAAAVAARLEGEEFPLVVDPVMVAGVGDTLARDDLVEALRTRIIPLATLVTPNVPEAEALVGFEVKDLQGVRRASREIADMGAKAVLIKGGHLQIDQCTDTLFLNGRFLTMEVPRVNIRGHGGGCILSSYLTASLAKGRGIWEAVLESKAAIDRSISHRFAVGHGVPVVDPLGLVMRDAQRYQVTCRLRSSSQELVRKFPKDHFGPGSIMAFALPEASGPGDVCSVGLGLSESDPLAGCPSFGSAGRAGEAVLAAMRSDGGMRAAVDLTYDEAYIALLRRAGLTMVRLKGDTFQKDPSQMEDAITMLGFVPDVVIDQAPSHTRPIIRVLGSSPEALLRKLGPVQR